MSTMAVPYPLEKRPESYDKYEFTLPELYRKLAKEELREDDEIREQSLEQMREWIAKHPYIRKCRTDSSFLLRFLRFRKFSVPMACEALERYLAMRETFPQWFKNLDHKEPALRQMLEDGVSVRLGTDETGRMVVHFRFAQFDVEKFNAMQEGRFTALIIESLLEWEEMQIGGVRVVADFRGSVMKHFGIWGVTDMKIFMDAVNRSYPLRLRQVHGVKFPKFAVPILNLLLTFASSKLRERIKCHENVESMAEHFEPSLLLKECGGLADPKALEADFLKHLEARHDVLLALDEMDIDTKHYSSLWASSSSEDHEVDAGVAGSFRKLAVD
ncbi:retinaldehyde-binding protein 1-like isoform X2 [Anopheles albimanus]|uniref:retinaldehyde-binding protein 1-like isoform X2 n=1 Tax=Anopheles albimanus TaxID=7167 RepID=UPI001642230E|nr:retinaldehyde-binding protein 1-like isoform X2 [Anopheles albimanus]